MWYAVWSLLILQKYLMFLICWLSLLIIIFIWNSFKSIMEKATTGLLESFHLCLICKNYIRPRKGKMSQTKRHAQQVKNKQGSMLLIPSVSYRTQCSVTWRTVLADLGPQRGMALSKVQCSWKSGLEVTSVTLTALEASRCNGFHTFLLQKLIFLIMSSLKSD